MSTTADDDANAADARDAGTLATGHAPEPWRWEHHRDNESCLLDLEGTSVLEGSIVVEDDEEWRAVAALIASSPTMYRYVRRKAGEGDDEAAQIIAGIDEALGKESR